MPRLARKDSEMPYNHIIVQGINKEYLFRSNKLKDKYKELMKKNLRKKKNIKLLAYCMMGNHAHMLFYTNRKMEISKLMQSVNTSYAQYYNRIKNRVGIVFRNRYFSQPIYSQKQLYNCLVYIHNNPVKAGLVENPQDYKYSSYNEWICKKGIIDEQAFNLVYGENLQELINFKEMHANSEVMDIEDIVEYVDYSVIIKEHQETTLLQLRELIQNEEYLSRLVLDLKNKSALSIRQISEISGVNRYKITKILKKFELK